MCTCTSTVHTPDNTGLMFQQYLLQYFNCRFAYKRFQISNCVDEIRYQHHARYRRMNFIFLSFIVLYCVHTMYDVCLIFVLQMRCFYDNNVHNLMMFQDECICHREAEKDEN